MSAARERHGRVMPNAHVEEMFARLSELNPKPVTELEYGSPYELLVAVTLSAQATDLEALPGVGRKTANVVLNTAFRQLAMAVDTATPG